MDDIPLVFAKDHLEDLVARVRRGEAVTINDGQVRLTLTVVGQQTLSKPYLDTLPPFVPLKEPRKLGIFAGEVPLPPDDVFAPMTNEELRDWYGDDT
jgi:antitoxin (DNA-binding transcriptional repressor) of toxin-antitoxin stability system